MTHTVLLVDDDAEFLYCVRRMLRNQPYLLHTARCGEDAVNVLKTTSVDVVVADECLPGMSGTDLLAWVARTFPDVVRLMLTGHAVTETIVRAVNEGGVYHFLSKPCNEAHLAITICNALEHKELLTRDSHLAEAGVQRVKDLDQFAKDLEVLTHLISCDLEKPLRCVAQSCQSLMEQHGDLFDPKAHLLIEETLDAVVDMQSLVQDLLVRTRAWQSSGRYSGLYVEPEVNVPRT